MSNSIVAYFSDPQNRKLELTESITLSFVLIATIIGSITSFIILISSAKRSLTHPHMMLIMSLMMADFLVSFAETIFLFMQLTDGAWNTKILDPVTFCMVKSTLSTIFVNCEAFSFALIAAERYFVIVKGWYNHEKITMLSIALSWISAIGFQSVLLTNSDRRYTQYLLITSSLVLRCSGMNITLT